MINFRFHLISLVAVFLALGVGVAMGASFVDRATVDSLRGRVDDLDEGYRRRGAELDATADQLSEVDGQAGALSGPDSEAVAGRLSEQPVVIVTSDGIPGDVLDSARTTLAASDAVLSGTVRLQPAIGLEDEGVLRRVRDRLGFRTGEVGEVRDAVVDDLGTALALLAAEPGGAGGGTTTTTDAGATTVPPTIPTTTPDGTVVVAGPEDVASARAYLTALADLGLITVDAAGAPADAAFPAVTGVRYVMVLGDDTVVDAADVMVPLATSTARTAPATVTVAEAWPSRADGEATTTTEGQPERGAILTDLREGDLADRLSTVDDLDEAFGRLSLVYAIAQQRDDGLVGHYGTGTAATAPFPTVPAG